MQLRLLQADHGDHKNIVTLRWTSALLVGLLMTGCGGRWPGDQHGGFPLGSPRKAAESLLGTRLPPGAQDVRFHRHEHAGDDLIDDVDKYSAYLKFRATHPDYLEFMQRLGAVVRRGSDPELRSRLPGDWHLAAGLHLDWWDPTLDIPDDTALGSFGVNGFIVAKRERGFVYLKVTDHGVPVP